MARIAYGSMLSRLASDQPEKVALVCEEGEITRRELDSGANRLARDFAEQGVGTGDLVSLVLPNGLHLVRAMFACWKLGAVPNPLSHRMPPVELARVLERAQPRLIMGSPSSLPAGQTTLDPSHEASAHFPDTPLPE